MNTVNAKRGGIFLLAFIALVVQTACFNSFNHGNEDNPNGSFAQQILVMVNVNESNQKEETSTCNHSVENPATIESTVTTTVAAGSICYFKYTASRGGLNPIFTLDSSSGDADLYVDYKNDSTGGTAGSSACDATTAGGGWDRCSRNHDSTGDSINSNSSGILTMSKNDFRLLAVYGYGDTNASFTLEVTD